MILLSRIGLCSQLSILYLLVSLSLSVSVVSLSLLTLPISRLTPLNSCMMPVDMMHVDTANWQLKLVEEGGKKQTHAKSLPALRTSYKPLLKNNFQLYVTFDPDMELEIAFIRIRGANTVYACGGVNSASGLTN